MRLYKFTFEVPSRNEEVSVFYLAKDDLDFLNRCVPWAHDSKEATIPKTGSTIKQWRDYHETNASYHQFMATALREREFDNKIDDMQASWESWEIADEDIHRLEQLHILTPAVVQVGA